MKEESQRQDRQQDNAIVIVDPATADYMPLVIAGRSRLWSFYFFTAGSDAMRWHHARHTRLWMINIRLPDMTGMELCEAMRPRLERIPVVLISDEYDPAEELAVFSAGTLHYMCKPLDLSLVSALWPVFDPRDGKNFTHSLNERPPF